MQRIPDEVVGEIRGGLQRQIEDVFESCGAELKGRGRNRRTSTCPSCGTRSRWDAVRVSTDRGWKCACCGKGGDAIAALAGFAGLDPRADFAKVLQLGAELVGVDLAPPADPAEAAARKRELASRREQRDQERRQRDAADVAKRTQAVAGARALWPRLELDSDRGRAYLAGRGIDPELLIAAGVVRFGRAGDPAVALYDDRGEVVNVVRRVIEPNDGPKTPGLLDCPSAGTLVGKVASVKAGSTVAVVEGVADALAASLAWPAAVVLGAHGAGNYAEVARLAGDRLKAVGGGRLLLGVDDDDPGRQAGTEAVEALIATGVDLALVEVVDLGEAHDLADAWRDGWRP